MLVDRLENICEDLGFTFTYGKEHWQNLSDFKNDADQIWEYRKKHLLLLYVKSKKTIDEYNNIVGEEYTGEFVLSVRGKLDDPTYQYKYEHNIKALEYEIRKLFKSFTVCEQENWQIKSWSETEVENMLDTTLDGKKVSFQIYKPTNQYKFFEPDSSYFALTTLFDLIDRYNIPVENKECLIQNFNQFIEQ
jgi:hypothetical protein